MLDTSKWTKAHWDANYELIRRGSFKHLYHSGQRKFFIDCLQRDNPPRYALLWCARQYGKTFGISIYAIQHCLAKPKRMVRHIFPTYKLAKEVMFSKFNEILEVLPTDLKPQFRRADAEWVFPNGSVYKLGGADPQGADSNRGNYSTLIIGDEAAFFDPSTFNYLMFSVLLPQTTHHPDAQIITVTTPPSNIAHPLVNDFLPLANREKAFMTSTIYENPLLSPKQIEDLCLASGGPNSNSWRREYMAEIVADDSQRVVPEYDTTKHYLEYEIPTHGITGEPVFFWGCVTADYGVSTRDYCAVTACIYDYVNNKLVVVRENMHKGSGLAKLSDTIKEFERILQEEYRCEKVDIIIDIMAQAGLELRNVYGLPYRSPSKVKIVDMLAGFRSAVEHDRIIVTKGCKTTDLTLTTGLWKNTNLSEQFDRSLELGHLDLLAALVYTFRACPWTKGFGLESRQVNNDWLSKKLPKKNIGWDGSPTKPLSSNMLSGTDIAAKFTKLGGRNG